MGCTNTLFPSLLSSLKFPQGRRTGNSRRRIRLLRRRCVDGTRVTAGEPVAHVFEHDRSAADQIELLPGTDDGAIGDQCVEAATFRSDVAAVHQGTKADRSVGIVDHTEGLPRTDRGAIGDE